MPLHQWWLIAYWAVWVAVMSLPRFLYRGDRSYEAWEVYAAHPQYAKMVRLYPYLSAVFGAPLFAGLLYVLYRAPWKPQLLVHVTGLLYGAFLILDASFAWHTGIRPLSAFGRNRFVMEAIGVRALLSNSHVASHAHANRPQEVWGQGLGSGL